MSQESTPSPLPRPRPALGRSLAIQAAGFAVGLAVHMMLSRWLGNEGYGNLSATLAVAMLVTTVALLGFDRSASQTVASMAAEGRGALATSFARVALVSVVVAALTSSTLLWGGTRVAELAWSVDEHPIRHAAFLIPPMAFAMLLGNLLTGLRRPLLSEILGQVSGRVLLLALAAWALFGPLAASEHLAVALVAVAWIVPLLLLAACLWHTWPSSWTPAVDPAGKERRWRSTARSYLVATLPLVALEESGILLMEVLHAAEAEVGIYAASHRTAGLPLIALAAARQLAVPDLATARAEGKHAFEATLRPYLRFVFVVGALVWLAFVVFGDAVLELFGHATEEGHLILVLLGGAYVVFLYAGLAAPVLQLHGEHRLVIGTMTTLLAASLVGGAAVLPVWGGEGLAATFLLTNLVVLGFLMREVRRRTGIRYLRLLTAGRTRASQFLRVD